MKRERRAILLILAACLPLACAALASGSAGQSSAPARARAIVPRKHPAESPLGRTFHEGRRRALAEVVKEGVVVLRGAEPPRNYLEFRQSNDFWYLTGVETPNAALVIVPKTKKTTLFLPPRNPHREGVEGPELSPGKEAAEITGIEEVKEISELVAFLEALKADGPFHTPLQPEELHATARDSAAPFENRRERDPFDGRVSREKAFANALKEKYGVEVQDLSPVLDELRRVKTKEEVGAMREASRVGSEGLIAAMRACRPGLFEYELGGIALGTFERLGAMGPGYMAIVGSGPNSLVLHYSRKHRKIEDGEIVLMDFGPEVFYSVADITRTWPANGKFTKRQREVYEACLRAQEETLKAVKPGTKISELGQIAAKALTDAGFGAFQRHGPSHYIGMSVHDVGEYDKPLEPGVCITVEPGIYIPEENLGVRIEDTVVVTKDGVENLSALCPREPSEIEAVMAGKAPKRRT